MSMRARIALQFASVCGIVMSTLVLGGCTMTAEERHHFKSVGEGHTNYFRVDVKACSRLSSARYLSGYFDESAVDTYFGSYKQPEGARLSGKESGPPAVSSPPPRSEESSADRTAAREVVPVDPTKSGKKLVLLLSSNSDEVAQQIGTLADGEEVSRLLRKLVSGRDDVRARQAELALEFRRRQALQLAELGQSLFGRLAPDDPAGNEVILVQYVNRIAASLGRRTDFQTLAEADSWLRENRALLEGDAR
jgi:hypothetical protein